MAIKPLLIIIVLVREELANLDANKLLGKSWGPGQGGRANNTSKYKRAPSDETNSLIHHHSSSLVQQEIKDASI